MTCDCYDFDAGQPRHLPAGDYYRQIETGNGQRELDIMRLLWRCWVVFKFRKTEHWTMDDEAFVHWLADSPPIDDTALNWLVTQTWQRQAA